MRKVLLLALVFAARIGFAADVYISGAAIYGRLSQNGAQWANSNNNYILDLVSPATGICYSFINTDVVPHSATIMAFITSDQNTKTFSGAVNQNWAQVAMSPVGPSYTFPANATTQLYARAPGGSHIVLTISGATGVGIVFIEYTQTPSPCGAVNAWTVTESQNGPAHCNTSLAILAGVTGVRHVANCVSVSVATAVATALTADWKVMDGGVAGSCTTGVVLWQSSTGFPGAIGNTDHVNVCGLNLSGTAGNALQLCFTGNPVSSQSCYSSMSGYDQ